MSTATDKLIESFTAMVKQHGVPIREEDNKARLELFEAKLPTGSEWEQFWGGFLTPLS